MAITVDQILSAGTTYASVGKVILSNSNGISFGVDGQTITATVATNYQSPGAYLTTAMLSNQSSVFAGIGETVTTIAGTDLALTVNTAGVNIAHPLWLTTAQPPGAYLTTAALSGDTSKYIQNWKLTGNTAGTTSSAQGTDLWLAGGNGVTISGSSNSLSFSVATNYQAQGAYLTTARASTDAIGLNTAQTNVTWTVNSSGISINASKYAGTGVTTAGGAGFSATNNTAGLSVSIPAWLTTAMASNRGSDFVAATAGFNGTNASGTMASNSWSISVADQSTLPLSLYAVSNTTQSTSYVINEPYAISFHGAGIASVGVSNGSVIVSVPAGGGGLTNINVSAGTTSNNLSNIIFSNSNAISFGLNGSTLTASVAGLVTMSGFDGYANNEFLAIAGGQATLWMDRLDIQCAMQFDRVGLRMTLSNATNSSGSATISAWVGVYTRNASTLSLSVSTSFSTAFTMSGTVGSYSNYGGIKILPIPWTTTITGGNYWLALISRTTTGGANMTIGNLGNSQIASTMSGFFGSGSNATNQIRLGVGVYSVTTAGLPAAINITQINGNSSAFLRQPAYLFMTNIF